MKKSVNGKLFGSGIVFFLLLLLLYYLQLYDLGSKPSTNTVKEYDFLISHRKIKFASNLDKLNRFNCANYDESGFKIFKPSLPVDMGISMPFKEFEILLEPQTLLYNRDNPQAVIGIMRRASSQDVREWVQFKSRFDRT